MNIIPQAQLERFILFMVHCSLGHDTTKVINRPNWWPQDIKFSSPLTRPKKINDVSTVFHYYLIISIAFFLYISYKYICYIY